MRIERAWTDLAHQDWNREAQSYGPDDDENDEDDTVLVDVDTHEVMRQKAYDAAPERGMLSCMERLIYEDIVREFTPVVGKPLSFDGRHFYLPGQPHLLARLLLWNDLDWLPHTDWVLGGPGLVVSVS